MTSADVNTVDLLISLMDTARGVQRPDLVVRGGRVVNVFTGEIDWMDVWIKHDRIAALQHPDREPEGGSEEVVEVEGAYVVPGLIDSHYHMGGSQLDPRNLTQALLARGTTGLATDFYEIYCTSGPEGVRHAIDEAHRAGLKILFLVPAHLIGMEDIGTFGWDVKPADMLEMLGWREAMGVMEPPASAILAKPRELLNIIDKTRRLGKIFAGHAPGQSGDALQAYLSTGASSEHESGRADEALDKLRLGMRPMMRESSASPDLSSLIELATKYPAASRFMMLCSDETDPGDLVRKGHMDFKVRMAIEAGVDPVVAIQMATINVAEYFGVSDQMGSVAPGRYADLLVVEDLKEFRARTVIASGRVVARDGRPETVGKDPPLPKWLRSWVNVPREFEPDDFRIAVEGVPNGPARARAIGVREGTLVSEAVEVPVRIRDGQVSLDPDQGVVPIAVAERYHGTGRIGKGLAEGLGIKDGAAALTYCHVYHNLLVVGSSPEQMALAANAVREMGGGVAVVAKQSVVARWPLPIIGVLDNRPLDEVQRSFEEMNDALRVIGYRVSGPILSLSFIALPTIPAYGLTDHGLYDVTGQRFVDLLV